MLNNQNKPNNSIKTVNLKDKKDPKVDQDKTPLNKTSAPTSKNLTRPPIQLFEKPKNLTTSNRDIKANKKGFVI